jgi:hypothetical protein
LNENLKKGYIQRSKAPYASGFFFVDKKDDKLRPCMDYRVLNVHTVKNKYPIPLVTEQLTHLHGKQWFTKLDIRWGYNNVRIKKGDQWKTAFKTNQGLFECNVMFFGLCNSPATFQAMMDEEFKDFIDRGIVFIYMDDIVIATEGPLFVHIREVTNVLQRLQNLDLFLKPAKCEFHRRTVSYLGFIVGEGRVRMDPIKVEAI